MSRMTAKDFTETEHTEIVDISEKASHKYDVMHRADCHTFRDFVFQSSGQFTLRTQPGLPFSPSAPVEQFVLTSIPLLSEDQLTCWSLAKNLPDWLTPSRLNTDERLRLQQSY
ncbi:hypothetical protein BM1_01128 [Bipolaris maydis]|nr:hypothetical protein BM1_01128 [Bipolaris maydis]